MPVEEYGRNHKFLLAGMDILALYPRGFCMLPSLVMPASLIGGKPWDHGGGSISQPITLACGSAQVSPIGPNIDGPLRDGPVVDGGAVGTHFNLNLEYGLSIDGCGHGAFLSRASLD